jgi:23S rRNA (uracil1939-C5)-methyltransferase
MFFEAQGQDLTWDGRSILRSKEGKIYFAYGVIPGEKVLLEELSFEKNFGRARVERILKPSPERQKPPCPHQGFEAGKCGGCPWMFMSYEAQLKWKRAKLEEILNREGYAMEFLLHPAGAELAYRRRAFLKVFKDKVGFLSLDSHSFAPIENCRVSTPGIQEKISLLRAEVQENPAKYPKLTEVFLSEASSETAEASEKASFEQVNAYQNTKLKERLSLYLENITTVNVVELFAGSGNFTEALLKRGPQRLFASESDAASCEKLRSMGEQVESYCADLFSAETLERIAYKVKAADTLLIDPPREGFKSLGKWIVAMPELKNFIYISCSPETWARDVETLGAQGFKLEAFEAFDMFPQTPHLEIFSAWKKA